MLKIIFTTLFTLLNLLKSQRKQPHLKKNENFIVKTLF